MLGQRPSNVRIGNQRSCYGCRKEMVRQIKPLFELSLRTITENPRCGLCSNDGSGFTIVLNMEKTVGNPKATNRPLKVLINGKSADAVLEEFLKENSSKAILQLSGDCMSMKCHFVIWYGGKLKELRVPEGAVIIDGKLGITRPNNSPVEVAELLPEDPCECLRQRPEWTLSYKNNGEACWKKQEALVPKAVPEEWIPLKTTFNGSTVDQMIRSIAEGNPGTRLQLSASNGSLPYLTLSLNGKKPKELWLPDGVKYQKGAISATNERGLPVCILETTA